MVEGPFGDRRQDDNTARLAMHVAAGSFPGETFYLKDFLPERDEAERAKEPAPQQGEEEMKSEWAAAVEGFNKG